MNSNRGKETKRASQEKMKKIQIICHTTSFVFHSFTSLLICYVCDNIKKKKNFFIVFFGVFLGLGGWGVRQKDKLKLRNEKKKHPSIF